MMPRNGRSGCFAFWVARLPFTFWPSTDTFCFAFIFNSQSRNCDPHICGYSPIYALLRTLGGAAGNLKRYGQWPDPNGVVSFASVVFE